MTINDTILTFSEKLIFTLRSLYESKGYRPYRMSKFEEYDLYAKNKDFLVSDNVITFTDTDGKLLALKPDVTLSIIKNSSDEPEKLNKVYYNENVYRVSKGTGSYKEIMQSGVECFGGLTEKDVSDVILLACESLGKIENEYALGISDIGLIESVMDHLGVWKESRGTVYKAISEKNVHETERICRECGIDEEKPALFASLTSFRGSVKEAETKLRALLDDLGCENSGFSSVLSHLASSPFCDKIFVDFSVIGDTHYYNGIVFRGFVKGIPDFVLSGGQYDTLMKKLKRNSKAIGFAVYLDLLERGASPTDDDGFINIALPKGRLGEKVYAMFEKAGFECPSILEPNRKLVFENKEKKLRYFWVKPSDVAIYVERGAADIGVAGKDILLEYEPEVFELLDLGFGVCRMAVAAPNGFADDGVSTLRVATKFSNIAKTFYQSRGRDIDIIHLNGSIEIAPILGLSDVIVDIVETGATLRENDLAVVEEIVPISARLIANKASFGFKFRQTENIVNGLSKILENAK